MFQKFVLFFFKFIKKLFFISDVKLKSTKQNLENAKYKNEMKLKKDLYQIISFRVLLMLNNIKDEVSQRRRNKFDK